jgi:hypothetical protein
LYFGRLSDVHIGGPSSNQAASLESQMIHPIQLLPGRTLTPNNGIQQNDCRDLICKYMNGPTLARGRAIAERLEKYTDGRSGLGLLFLIAGKEGRDHKISVPYE